MIHRIRDFGESPKATRWVFTSGSWAAKLILVPVFAATVLLAVFFFAVFAALLAVAAGGIGLWLWWRRRKLRKAGNVQTLEGDYVVIERSTEIMEQRNERTLDG